VFRIIKPRTLFLVDAAGAALSAIWLAGVIAPFENFFGVPPALANGLALGAVVLMGYSAACWRFAGQRWRTLLRGTAFANATYIMLTIACLSFQAAQLLVPAFIYFGLEALVVGVLVVVEWKTANAPD
jgi:hypothetical protein